MLSAKPHTTHIVAYHPVGVGLVVNNLLPEGRGFYAATRGRRVLPVTMGHHHKPFESAETARGLRGVPSIWSERSSHCGAQSAVGRAIKAFDHRIGERYTIGSTSVLRAAREG